MTPPPQLRPTLIALATMLALAAGQASANTFNYYLKLGDIKGASTQAEHLDWNIIDSFQWGLHMPVSSPGGGGGISTGMPFLSDFSWTQTVDVSITKLFESAASGKALGKATLHVTTPTGKGGEATFFEMVFDKAILTNLNLSGATGSPPYLSAGFAYEKITMKYTTLDGTGKPSTSFEGMYDLTKNEGSLAMLSMVYSMGMSGPTIAAPIPEPETWAMLLAGLGLVGLAVRRQSKRV
jgi:type VI protein secretion system component Hcp